LGFFCVLFPIEPIFLEGIFCAVSKVAAFAINTFEQMWIGLILLCLRYRRVGLWIFFVAPYHQSMVLNFVRPTVLLALGTMCLAHIGSVPPFPVVFILWVPRIYTSSMECGYIVSKIEVPVY